MCIRDSDRIGRTGVEAAYERHLRGKWGGQMLEVNAMGEVQRNLGDRPSQAGKDLVLTLDLDLQRVAEQALADKPGGAVVARWRPQRVPCWLWPAVPVLIRTSSPS